MSDMFYLSPTSIYNGQFLAILHQFNMNILSYLVKLVIDLYNVHYVNFAKNQSLHFYFTTKDQFDVNLYHILFFQWYQMTVVHRYC